MKKVFTLEAVINVALEYNERQTKMADEKIEEKVQEKKESEVSFFLASI